VVVFLSNVPSLINFLGARTPALTCGWPRACPADLPNQSEAAVSNGSYDRTRLDDFPSIHRIPDISAQTFAKHQAQSATPSRWGRPNWHLKESIGLRMSVIRVSDATVGGCVANFLAGGMA
jgi:hypothetical protein